MFEMFPSFLNITGSQKSLPTVGSHRSPEKFPPGRQFIGCLHDRANIELARADLLEPRPSPLAQM